MKRESVREREREREREKERRESISLKNAWEEVRF